MRGRGSEGDNPYTYKSVSWKRVIIIITTTTKHKLIKKYIYILLLRLFNQKFLLCFFYNL